jgi:hypothetical protein
MISAFKPQPTTNIIITIFLNLLWYFCVTLQFGLHLNLQNANIHQGKTYMQMQNDNQLMHVYNMMFAIYLAWKSMKSRNNDS